MSKARIDAQGRKWDAEGKRVYDKAGANTYVEAVHPGTYPANHLRAVGEKFKLKEGDGIVDWMREVEGDEAPAKAPRAPRAPKAEPAPAAEPGQDQVDPDLA